MSDTDLGRQPDRPASSPATRVQHSGPDTKFCVLCLSGEHQRAHETPATEAKR